MVDAEDPDGSPAVAEPEEEANEFAAAILMPARLMREQYETCGRDFSLLCRDVRLLGGGDGSPPARRDLKPALRARVLGSPEFGGRATRAGRQVSGLPDDSIGVGISPAASHARSRSCPSGRPARWTNAVPYGFQLRIPDGPVVDSQDPLLCALGAEVVRLSTSRIYAEALQSRQVDPGRRLAAVLEPPDGDGDPVVGVWDEDATCLAGVLPWRTAGRVGRSARSGRRRRSPGLL